MKKIISLTFCMFLAMLFLTPHAGHAETKEITITITADGFSPPNITVEKGKTTRLIFIRTTKKTCVKRVKIAQLGIEEKLPLNKPVAIEIVPEKSGVIGFGCPMDMVKGEITVTD